MYKKAMSCLLLIQLLFLSGFLCVCGVEKNLSASAPAFEIKLEESRLADTQSSMIGIVPVAASGQRIVNYEILERKEEYYLSNEDLTVLQRIVEAEAGTEDIEGRLLVANVVLNRMKNDAFPDTVSEVVFQKAYGVTQFSPVANGSFWEVQISEETKEAVEMALQGEDISQGAMYFAARKYADSEQMKWFDEKLTFLFQHGGHEFFR